ncbi:MAG: MBL fold metallo-hydrolase [Candidatus Xenobiia bacterium LiM19]
MALHPLNSDQLYIAVLGPGFGESILIRVPPSYWAVIDSTTRGSSVLPNTMLHEADAKDVVGIALTHPHMDHGSGLHELIDHYPDLKWLACIEAWLPEAPPTHDLSHDYTRGRVKQTLERIRSAWYARPEIRWDLKAHTSRVIGDAKLTALLPVVLPVEVPSDCNVLCTPFLIEWRSCRVLLGADTLIISWQGVDDAMELYRHNVYKVAHHASETGINSSSLCKSEDEERSRFWVATPYNRGFQLPRFEDGQGVAQLLTSNDCLHLTALPFRSSEQFRGRVITRQQINGLKQRTAVKLAEGLTVQPVPAECEALDGVIWIGLDREGNPVDVRYGPDSLQIVEGLHYKKT